MRACFVFSIVTSFATSLAAQSHIETTSKDDLSGSITIANLPLPPTRNQSLASRSSSVLWNLEPWARRFPDEVDHRGTKVEKTKSAFLFSHGTLFSESITKSSPAKSPEPIVIPKQMVGGQWWVDWPSANLHNTLRPAP